MPVRHFPAGLTWDSFFLTYSPSEDFLFSTWSSNPLVYAVWSTICSLYTICMTIATGFTSGYGIKIGIWLTYWSFYCLTLRFIVTACNCWNHILHVNKAEKCTVFYLNKLVKNCCHDTLSSGSNETRKSQIDVAVGLENGNNAHLDSFPNHHHHTTRKLPAKLAFQWLLQNISNASSLLITALFWTLVYAGEVQNYNSINAHVLNSLMIIADIIINRAPIRVQHFHIPLAFLSIYILFTIVYWLGGGTNHKDELFIYNVLDYFNRPTTASVAILTTALLGVPLTQVMLYCLFRARLKLHAFWQKRDFFFHQQHCPKDLSDVVATDGNQTPGNVTTKDLSDGVATDGNQTPGNVTTKDLSDGVATDGNQAPGNVTTKDLSDVVATDCNQAPGNVTTKDLSDVVATDGNQTPGNVTTKDV